MTARTERRCAYCLGENRRERSAFCSDAHAKRWRAHVVSVREGRKRAMDAVLRRMHARRAVA